MNNLSAIYDPITIPEARAHRPKSKTTTFSSSSMMYVSTELGPVLSSPIYGIPTYVSCSTTPSRHCRPSWQKSYKTDSHGPSHMRCDPSGLKRSGPTRPAHACCGYRCPRFGGARSDQPSARKAQYIAWRLGATCNVSADMTWFFGATRNKHATTGSARHETWFLRRSLCPT